MELYFESSFIVFFCLLLEFHSGSSFFCFYYTTSKTKKFLKNLGRTALHKDKTPDVLCIFTIQNRRTQESAWANMINTGCSYTQLALDQRTVQIISGHVVAATALSPFETLLVRYIGAIMRTRKMKTCLCTRMWLLARNSKYASLLSNTVNMGIK